MRLTKDFAILAGRAATSTGGEAMKYPKYVKTSDGYIGTFQYLEFGEFPVYRFEGGDRIADEWELERGSDNREDLL